MSDGWKKFWGWAGPVLLAAAIVGGVLYLWSNDGAVDAKVCGIDETTMIRNGAFDVETTEGEFHVTKATFPGGYPDPDELRNQLRIGKMVRISYRASSYSRTTIYDVKALPDDPSVTCPS